ncbi:mannose-1-phosphate guanylyltransferase [Sphingorhabdus sp.]|uniref:mannose-1-phosphate guanylyltransferase n=1 Tax=Sphingorhabdus sp. TaxID=1902408 RepID=UPI00391B9EFD
MTITPVILSGGGGTRLWPLSTPQTPKQFLALTSERTMFQLTVLRVMDRQRFAAPIIVANAAHAAIVSDQLAEIGVSDAIILLEPCARNTAPAIALAALAVEARDRVLLVMPSDHVINNEPAFHHATDVLLPAVHDGWLATYGINPSGPETGYGYIQMGPETAEGLHTVQRFVEKPDAGRAAAMIAAGDHVWNGGIFLFRADSYLNAMAQYAPAMELAVRDAMAKAVQSGNQLRPDHSSFARSPADSIDYAIMEKASNVAVARVSMGWSDVGSWDALHEIGQKDAEGNVAFGNVRIESSHGNLIHADGVRVSVYGVDDLLIIANGREVMILPRGTSQKVRDFAAD